MSLDQMKSTLEFTFTNEQQKLREQARDVARKGVEKHGRFNDSWINGFSKEFAQTMAENGWIGMGWPKELHEKEVCCSKDCHRKESCR